jgi:hypothetical protein
MASFVRRLGGALRLDVATYEEVENDTGATGQALLVVLLVAVASGIGASERAEGAAGFVAGLLAAIVGWILWAALTWLIGARFLPEAGTQADVRQLLRTLGFAQAPGLFRVVGAVPVLGVIVTAVTGVWMLAAFVVAVRQALDYRSTGRAVLVCVIGFAVYVAASLLIFLILGISPRQG